MSYNSHSLLIVSIKLKTYFLKGGLSTFFNNSNTIDNSHEFLLEHPSYENLNQAVLFQTDENNIVFLHHRTANWNFQIR